MSTAEQRAAQLGLDIPDYADPPYGRRYGRRLKAFHRTGNLVEFSGITPENRQGDRLFPGTVGADVTLEQANQAARLTAIHALGMIRYAVGSLDNVASLSRALCFVMCTPGYEPLYDVSNGATDLFLDVFGDEIGSVGRATIGAASLSRNNCFELWLSLEASPEE
ncbi:RidA family protein [Herbiconiux ginsengi]|uniref:Enamine deaminase RidA, house cleaning of reactive enamine intermediates, YjgF/YER057c/UK114 family n=1 Tax=Herbiconiux ginsengi TaxID=381665 RepID=A0A1H3SXT0_9MICO|nr:RidA family protein [Herbiconiux ginsengi]SDZ42305.1 Enamine deaminase RidA, house cleaning of reactive enamine intermediates, YjgF/YER057c/UK114 family [Herbiconiux ginsengi]